MTWDPPTKLICLRFGEKQKERIGGHAIGWSVEKKRLRLELEYYVDVIRSNGGWDEGKKDDERL